MSKPSPSFGDHIRNQCALMAGPTARGGSDLFFAILTEFKRAHTEHRFKSSEDMWGYMRTDLWLRSQTFETLAAGAQGAYEWQPWGAVLTAGDGDYDGAVAFCDRVMHDVDYGEKPQQWAV